MLAGCYVLHLYCDVEGCPLSRARGDHDAAATYIHEHGKDARADAKRDGWTWTRHGVSGAKEGTVRCPKHSLRPPVAAPT